MITRHRGVMRGTHDDGGAVAVMVALLLPMVLLGAGALAVDLGALYVQRSAMSGTARLAALAAARLLPDVTAARLKALQVMCADANVIRGWPDGTCPADPADWIPRRAAGAGSITFFLDDKDPDGPKGPDGRYDDTDPNPSLRDPVLVHESDQAVAVRVTLPDARIDYHFTGAMPGTPDSAQVSESATARIGTPLGTGMFPFAVTPADLASGSDDRICVKDPTSTSGTGPPAPTGFPSPGWITIPFVTPSAIAADATDRRLTLTAVFLGRFPANPEVYFGTTAFAGDVVSATPTTIVVDVPAGVPPGFLIPVWVQTGNGSYVSRTGIVNITSTGVVDPCDRPAASRGVLDVQRPENPAAPLADNLRTGVVPTVHDYTWQGSLLPPLTPLPATQPITNLSCNDFLLSTYTLIRSVINPFDVNCVDTRPSGFAPELTSGLLDTSAGTPGRLLRRCSGETSSIRGVTVDGTDLFSGDQLVNTAGYPGDGGLLRTAIQAQAPPAYGWIKDEVFSCPRMGLVPIIDPSLPVVAGQYPVIGHTYVWLDDDASVAARWSTSAVNRMTAVKGHIIDPRYFIDDAPGGTGESNVEGSAVVGEYLGPELPKEAVLVEAQS